MNTPLSSIMMYYRDIPLWHICVIVVFFKLLTHNFNAIQNYKIILTRFLGHAKRNITCLLFLFKWLQLYICALFLSQLLIMK